MKVLLVGDSHVRLVNGYIRPALAARGVTNVDIVNAGIGGDQALHVLWRVEDMCLPTAYSVCVIHVGVNDILNSFDNPSFAGYTPASIAGNIVRCASELRDCNPGMDIAVMGILPTKDMDGDLNLLVRHLNLHLEETCLTKGFKFVSTNSTKWGAELYARDQLHLSKFYQTG